MNLAVIPARGGSKRIRRKNILPFAGRPMLVWSIAAARDSGLFERIIVSTDSAEVAQVAREAGAEVPFERPAELSNDHCGTLEVITHSARWATDEGLAPEAVCCLYATAPFVEPGDLQTGLDTLKRGGWDYVLAAGKFPQPVQRAFIRKQDGALDMLFPEQRLTRSQDLPAVYHDAGQFYWGTTEAWLESRPIFGTKTAFIELPPERVRDIDTPEDWTIAEHLIKNLRRTGDEQ